MELEQRAYILIVKGQFRVMFQRVGLYELLETLARAKAVLA